MHLIFVHCCVSKACEPFRLSFFPIKASNYFDFFFITMSFNKLFTNAERSTFLAFTQCYANWVSLRRFATGQRKRTRRSQKHSKNWIEISSISEKAIFLKFLINFSYTFDLLFSTFQSKRKIQRKFDIKVVDKNTLNDFDLQHR